MSVTEQVPAKQDSFSRELEVRIAEAEAVLSAAEVLDDPLSAQIAAADLADLRAMASRNDVLVPEPARQPSGA